MNSHLASSSNGHFVGLNPQSFEVRRVNEKGEIRQKRSALRQELEALLQQKGLVLESGITAVNLDSKESQRFDDYEQLMAFLKGTKGRWYVTTPGLRSAKKSR